jgi:hypothetical protein
MRRLLLALVLLAAVLPVGPPAAAQDPAAEMERLIQEAQAQPSMFGPVSGDILLEAGTVNVHPAEVSVRDFFAHATFTNPYSAAEHLFDFGISFRRTSGDEAFSIVVDSDGGWFLIVDTRQIANGRGVAIASGADETNHLDLVVVGDTGYFSVNDEFVDTIDLSERDTIGDVVVGAGYFVEDKIEGRFTPYTGFEVWSLDGEGGTAPDAGTETGPALGTEGEAGTTPGSDAEQFEALMAQAEAAPGIAGPFSGDLAMAEGGVDLYGARVNVRDFFAHATITNPYPAAEHLWDIGFSFRRTAPDNEFKLIIDSNGAWFFKEGLDPPIATGQASGLATGENETNHLDLVAVGNTGYFAVNGTFVSTLDLSARDFSGEVAVGTGFYTEDKVVGERAQFTEFEVWTIDAAAPATGADDGGGEGSVIDDGDGEGQSSGIVAGGAEEIIFDLLREDGPGLFGIVAMSADGQQTRVQIGAFEAAGNEEIGIHSGTCVDFNETPLFRLNSVSADSLTAESVLDVALGALTDGGYVIVVRGANGGPVVACSMIPAS